MNDKLYKLVILTEKRRQLTITDLFTLSISLNKNIKIITDIFNSSSNLKIRKFKVRDKTKKDAAILYLDGITNNLTIQEYILTPLLKMTRFETIGSVVDEHISVVDVVVEDKLDEIKAGLTKGKCLVLIDGFNEGILADVAEWQTRAVTEPDTQRTTKGSLVGFNEQLKVNLNLLQNLIQTNKLIIESFQIGNDSKTDVALLFMEGYVDEKVLNDTRNILKGIDVKYLLQARVIVDALEKKKTLFPLVYTCERPDVTVSALYEGRVVILVNGIPYVLIVPSLFIHYFQQPDEYNSKAGRFGSRIIRFYSWLLALLLPAFYIAIARFHSHWIPTPFDKKLLTSSDTLLPYLIEVLFLLLIFQLLIEASVRIPKTTILIVSLIGAITVGETLVSAKLIHPLTLIVVGTNFLSSIMIATGGLWGSLNVLRLIFVIIANFFGITGILVLFIITIGYIATLRSMGVPYLAPFIPLNLREMKDVIFRGDLRKLINSKHTLPS